MQVPQKKVEFVDFGKKPSQTEKKVEDFAFFDAFFSKEKEAKPKEEVK